MLRPWHLLLLPLVLANQHLTEDKFTFNSNSPIQEWFQDKVARRAFMRILGGEMHPLEAGLAAHHSSVNRITPPSKEFRRCLADIGYVIASSVSDTRALQILDSSVKTPVGILSASFTHMGNWDECVNVRNVNYTVSGAFHGKMCMTTFSVTKKNTNSSWNSVDEEFPDIPDQTARSSEIMSIASRMSLKLGMCVPSSCSAKHVQQFFNTLLWFLPTVSNMKLVARVSDPDCTTLDRPTFEATEWFGVVFFSLFGLVLVSSTVYDLLVPAERKLPVLASFSVVANGRKVLAMPRPGGDQTLSSLHGIRVISMCWIVLGHRFLKSVMAPMMNPLKVLDFLDTWYHIGILNATVSVDTFFAMSGLLLSYLYFRQPEATRSLHMPKYYIHRYIRLTPPFAAMILFIATLVAHVGFGPLWDGTMNEERDICRKNWWNSLLYINNYVDAQNQCGPTWYLMIDMQLHWVAPLVLVPMSRWPRKSVIIIAFLMIAGLITNFTLSYVKNLPGNKMTTFDHDRTYFYVKHFYVPTHTRFMPYLEGIVMGYILAKERANGKKPQPLNGFVKFLAWIAVAGLMLVPLLSGLDFILPPLPSKFWTSVYNSVHRPTWAMGVLGVIYLCANGNGGPVNTFLSWWGFQILGRLTYGVYLVHMTIMNIQNSLLRTNIYIGDGPILTTFAGDLVTAFFFAGILSVCFESPFLVLEKELLGGGKTKKRTPNIISSAPQTSREGVNGIVEQPTTSLTRHISENGLNITEQTTPEPSAVIKETEIESEEQAKST